MVGRALESNSRASTNIALRRRQIDRTALSDQRMAEARGMADATLSLIGERAGYSRGLVTARFGSKAALFASG